MEIPAPSKLEWRIYKRSFSKPIHTAHGIWRLREGLIVRLSDERGHVAYGECAPLPAFGTETLAAACVCLEQSGGRFDGSILNSSAVLPSLSHALTSAASFMKDGLCAADASGCGDQFFQWPVCALMPAGPAALIHLEEGLMRGYTTFKWKIGVHCLDEELSICKGLLAILPENASLRLDANGSLDLVAAEKWCDFLAINGRDRCAFIEQPLAPGQEPTMVRFQERFGNRIALDESLTAVSAGSGERLRNLISSWPGYFVWKPSLLGGSEGGRLTQLGLAANRLVFSSAFETDIGIDALLRIVAGVGDGLPAIGLDTVAAFDDGLNTDEAAPMINFVPRQQLRRAQAVWDALG